MKGGSRRCVQHAWREPFDEGRAGLQGRSKPPNGKGGRQRFILGYKAMVITLVKFGRRCQMQLSLQSEVCVARITAERFAGKAA